MATTCLKCPKKDDSEPHEVKLCIDHNIDSMHTRKTASSSKMGCKCCSCLCTTLVVTIILAFLAICLSTFVVYIVFWEKPWIEQKIVSKIAENATYTSSREPYSAAVKSLHLKRDDVPGASETSDTHIRNIIEAANAGRNYCAIHVGLHPHKFNQDVDKLGPWTWNTRSTYLRSGITYHHDGSFTLRKKGDYDISITVAGRQPETNVEFILKIIKADRSGLRELRQRVMQVHTDEPRGTSPYFSLPLTVLGIPFEANDMVSFSVSHPKLVIRKSDVTFLTIRSTTLCPDHEFE